MKNPLKNFHQTLRQKGLPGSVIRSILRESIKPGRLPALIMTRKIEAEMVTAIREVLADSNFSGCYWKNSNTSVYQKHESGPNGARWIEVIYHETMIALIEPGANRISFYNGNYETKTTKSRINTIMAIFTDGFSLFQEKKIWKYERNCWNKGEPFYNGLCLGLYLR